MNSVLPERLAVTAILDPSPRYAGTSHDDATARAMGFRAALIPGAFVYGHVTRIAVQGWGEDWLARGRAAVRFRRPVHNGDPLLVERGPLVRDETGVDAEVTVTQTATGEVVLTGSIGLADRAPEPPPLPEIPPTRTPRLELTAGSVEVGLTLGSDPNVLSDDVVRQSLADFHETEAIYRERGLIHSGCLVRRTMGDTLGNLVLPMPVIFAGLQVQNVAPAPVGRTYRTFSRITKAWEARGKHFFDSEEWLVADGGLVVARHLRTNLYAMEG